MPRLRPPCHDPLALHEYPGALLHRLPGRHRRPRRSGADGFSAWYEVFLDGRWFSLDARHNHPRIGRIVIARGRDAADVAISTAFGPAQLARFNVITEELKQADQDIQLREAA